MELFAGGYSRPDIAEILGALRANSMDPMTFLDYLVRTQSLRPKMYPSTLSRARSLSFSLSFSLSLSFALFFYGSL